jgi:hypothetical protein
MLAAMIDPGVEERLGKLVKLLASDKDGEVIAAARAIARTLNNAGADFHELAARIRGEKLSQAEMQKIYDAAFRDGKDAAAVDRGFDNVDGPSWHEMATICAERDNGRLTSREREFIDDMISWTARRDPSDKQGRWLHSIYVKLGRRR